MLSVSADHLRLFLHLVAATIWVGGQLTLAGLVPGLRRIGPDLPRTMARRFNRIAWPAYGVLVVTGTWNLFEVDITDQDTDYQVTLMLKLVVVAVSGVAAFVHSATANRAALAVFGALTAVAALGALFLGVQLVRPY